jgi:glycosyltransferase involved in cell wall biosynthesis
MTPLDDRHLKKLRRSAVDRLRQWEEQVGHNDDGLHELRVLEEDIVSLCQEPQNVNLLRRLARVYARLGSADREIEVLKRVLQHEPLDPIAGNKVSRDLEQKGEIAKAAALAERALEQEPNLRQLARIVSLRLKSGNGQDSENIIARAWASFPNEDGTYDLALRFFVETSQHERALAVARDALARNASGLALRFRAFQVLCEATVSPQEKKLRRAEFMKLADGIEEGFLWKARLYKWEGDWKRAMEQYNAMLTRRRGHPAAMRERALLAYAGGQWASNAAVLREALSIAKPGSELERCLNNVNGLFAMMGSSLAKAAQGDLGSVSSPATVVRHLTTVVQPIAYDSTRRGVVMVGGALTSGGADRMLATTFRAMRQVQALGPVKLCVFDLAEGTPNAFSLPLTGANAREISVLRSHAKPAPPIAWLPPSLAAKTQALYEKLIADKPHTLHAWLDTPNICAGVAGLLAGVPHIVLHIHSFRPAISDDQIPLIADYAECYRALLRRKEVVLVGCAEACVRDYLDWINVEEDVHTVTVPNGFEFEAFEPAPSDSERHELRRVFNIPADALVLGTAFRFTDVKRPLRWVEAAKLVSEVLPDTHFVMFGTGELWDEVVEYVESLGLTQAFHLPGEIPNLPRFLPLLDIFMLSSRSEGTPNTLIEAQAAGVPVISYDVGAVAETMEDGATGLLVRDDTPEALAAAVVSAFQNSDWRRKAGTLGASYVRAKFGMPAMIIKLTDVLMSH